MQVSKTMLILLCISAIKNVVILFWDGLIPSENRSSAEKGKSALSHSVKLSLSPTRVHVQTSLTSFHKQIISLILIKKA